MSNPQLDLNDPANFLSSVDDPVEKLNLFIRKWCGDNAAHLLDNDDNDGEVMRQLIAGLNPQPLEDGELRAAISKAFREPLPEGRISTADIAVGMLSSTDLGYIIGQRIMPLFKAELERRERELYTKEEVIRLIGEDTSCSTCGRLIEPTTEWICERCDNIFHEDCAGYSYDGEGEYPSESAYALCKKCDAKAQLTPTPESKHNEETE